MKTAMPSLNPLPVPPKAKCCVCGNRPQALGVNSNGFLTICEDCDRRNNPYYYRAHPSVERGYMLAVQYVVSTSVSTTTKIDKDYIHFDSPYGHDSTTEIMSAVLQELGESGVTCMPISHFSERDLNYTHTYKFMKAAL